MSSPGDEHRDRRLPSYPCARLRNWSRQTFWQYPLGTTVLFRQYPVLTIELRSDGTLPVPNCFSSSILFPFRTPQHGPPRSSRSGAKPSRNSPRRLWKSEVAIDCYSEKRSRPSQWSGCAPTGTRAWGASSGSTRHKTKTACTHAIDRFFSGRKQGLYQQIDHRTLNVLSMHRSIRLQFARLHGSSNVYASMGIDLLFAFTSTAEHQRVRGDHIFCTRDRV